MVHKTPSIAGIITCTDRDAFGSIVVFNATLGDDLDSPFAVRLLIRFVGLLAIMGWIYLSPWRDTLPLFIGVVSLYFLVHAVADGVFESKRRAQSDGINNPILAVYDFPTFTDEEIRNARIRSFVVGALIAVLPAAFNTVWRWFDGGEILDSQSFRQALPDFAIAGVGITISAYTNTVYSIARLSGGDRTTGGLTFICLLIGAVCALLCFLAYLKANHALPSNQDASRMFYTSLTLAISSFVFSYAAVSSFVADELRGARAHRTRLPAPRAE